MIKAGGRLMTSLKGGLLLRLLIRKIIIKWIKLFR